MAAGDIVADGHGGQLPPNRKAFEGRLAKISEHISELERRRRAILGPDGPKPSLDLITEKDTIGNTDDYVAQYGELYACRRLIAIHRQHRRAAKVRLDEEKRKMAATRQQIDAKRNEISPLDRSGDILFKDEEKLRKKLTEMTAYHRTKGFDNRLEEVRIVKEIDKLTRNLDKLPTYLTLKNAEKKLHEEYSQQRRIADVSSRLHSFRSLTHFFLGPSQ